MSVSFNYQSSSYSSSSTSRVSRTRMSTGLFPFHAPSVYGGAGGDGTRISRSHSVMSSGSLTPNVETALINNRKMTMQNLNDRLSSYLEKVRSLEAANRKLELQITDHYQKRAPTASKDFSSYFNTIAELQAQISSRTSENQRIILQLDTAQMAADDFKTKYEMELNMCMTVEGDVPRLRGIRDSLTLSISDLEGEIEALAEELLYIKSNHEEGMQQLMIQQTGTVNVEVDNAESADLAKVLEEMRERYESVMVKNKMKLEKWFQSKGDIVQTQVMTCTQEVKTFQTQLSELKKSTQSLEMTRQCIITEIQCLQQNVQEVESQWSVQLSQLQLTINVLEIELQRLNESLKLQHAEYDLLLDVKMRLEVEIAEYRRLLEGELHEEKFELIKTVVISEVEEMEEHKPHMERRVKIIVEDIVDGKVVSSSVDTKVENIQ